MSSGTRRRRRCRGDRDRDRVVAALGECVFAHVRRRGARGAVLRQRSRASRALSCDRSRSARTRSADCPFASGFLYNFSLERAVVLDVAC